MAVTTEFESNWLEMQQKYGSGIDSGDVDVIEEGQVDETISLPSVKFQQKYVKGGNNVFVGFRHVPMDTFMAPIAGAVEDAETAAQAATDAAGSVQGAIDDAEAAAAQARMAAGNADMSRQQIEQNEATRQQNETTRQNQESSRQTAESGRSSAESGRVTAEAGRSSAESGRASAEQGRVSAEGGRVSAEQGRVSAEQARHTQAGNDHSRAEQDHSTIESAVAGAENVNAELDGMTVKITDRTGTTRSVDVSLDFYETYSSVAAMNADAANIPKCALVSIATDDPTSAENARVYQKRSDGTMKYLFDLDQASAQAWAEWLNTKKPQIDAAISDAEAATDDANAVVAAWNTPTTGYQAQMDAALLRAGQDHTRAEGDHGTAGIDHTTAGNDHTTAGNDHARSENVASHPPYIADGTAAHPGDAGYFYSWDYDTQQYVRGALLSLDWASMTEAQREELARAVLAAIGFDELPTQGSDNAVKSDGLYTALGGQSQLTFAANGTCEDIIDELF